MVSRWAAENQVTVVRKHPTWFLVGPWPLVGGGHQTVRYLTVRDAQGRERDCWLLLGHFLWGLTDQVEVVWRDR